MFAVCVSFRFSGCWGLFLLLVSVLLVGFAFLVSVLFIVSRFVCRDAVRSVHPVLLNLSDRRRREEGPRGLLGVFRGFRATWSARGARRFLSFSPVSALVPSHDGGHDSIRLGVHSVVDRAS